MHGELWLQVEIDLLLSLCPTGHLTPDVLDVLARNLRRTKAAIRTKRTELGLRPRHRTEIAPAGCTDAPAAEGIERGAVDDGRFAAAMRAAIAAGLERPPMLGIDTRPCTKAPVFVERGQAEMTTRNVLADI